MGPHKQKAHDRSAIVGVRDVHLQLNPGDNFSSNKLDCLYQDCVFDQMHLSRRKRVSFVSYDVRMVSRPNVFRKDKSHIAL